MWAFSDESERGERMFMAVVFIPTAALNGARAELRKLLLPGQRRIHTRLESPRRRRVLLDTVAGSDATAVVFRARRSKGDRTDARRRLQRARDDEAMHVLLDDPDVSRRPTYDHRPGYSEPLLWAAEAICWAVGAGQDWHRRVSRLVEVRNVP